jgi:hypothetical protein
MPSRADVRDALIAGQGANTAHLLRLVGGGLHALGVSCMLLLAWRLFTPAPDRPVTASVTSAGTIDRSLGELLLAHRDTIDVTLDGLPNARTRAALRAVRGSGHAVRLVTPAAPPALAVAAEREWKASGGTRVQVVSGDTSRQVVADAAGLIDSIAIDSVGLRTRSGPIEGVVTVGAAAVTPLAASAPDAARVLVIGEATWESRFLIAALEEAGWPVDAAVSLSPRVTVTQGAAPAPNRSRHAIVVVLPGAPSSAFAALPAFVRSGGGLVIVGEAARAAGLGTLRAGTPGVTISGEMGAEASDEPRHGLDLVPISALADGSVALESREGRVAVAARRIGAGRVMQVGYDNSWFWRMGGNDDAPSAHRAWWSTLLSGLVPVRVATVAAAVTPEHDTLDAAPVAAMVRDLGMPTIRTASTIAASRTSFVASLDPRWLLAGALLSLVASWTLRRWRGLA